MCICLSHSVPSGQFQGVYSILLLGGSQIIRFGSKCLYLLRHLTSWIHLFYFSLIKII